MSRLLSDRIKKTPPGEVLDDRYEFLRLSDAEPDLGVPLLDNGISSSLLDGTRQWLYPNLGLAVDVNGNITVNEDTVVIDTSGFTYSTSSNLHDVLTDLDNAIAGAVQGISEETDTLASVTTRGNITTNSISVGNITTSGYLRGPATFVIDPAGFDDNTGNVIIAGNLTVQGTTTTVNSNEVNIGNAIILLNSDETGAPTQNSGIEVERGTSDNVSLLWDEITDRWTVDTESFEVNSFYVTNYGEVINSSGEWIGPATGLVGETGATGSQGYTGSQGFTGSQGYTGSQGIQGYAGSQGDTGFTGSKGDQGDIGYTGSQGIQGDIGFTGSQGDTGFTGSRGATGFTGSQGDIGYTGSQGDIGYTGSQGYIGSGGTTGFTGSKGEDGNFGGATFDYTFSDEILNSDPGSGNLRLNNISAQSATELYIDDQDRNATDIQQFLRTIDDSSSTIKGHFRISNRLDASDFALYTISSVAEQTGYFQVFCGFVSGSATAFSDSEDIIITFARTGDRGAPGFTGSQGSPDTANDILAKLVTVDGAGSGLDADALDGQNGSFYLDYNNFVNTPADNDTIYTAGAGIDLSGTEFSVAAGSGLTQDASGLSHADTSTQESLIALTGTNVVSDIDLDEFGHVTSLTTRSMSLADFDSNLSSFVSAFTLPTSDGTTDQILKTDGAGTLLFTNPYSNSDVDLHLNTASAFNNQILSWTGSDYDWVDGGGGGLTQEQLDVLNILQDDSAYFYTAVGDLYDKSQPRGPDTSIQVNNAGIFSGYSALTFNSGNSTLTATNLNATNSINSEGDITALNFNTNGGNLSVVGNATITGDLDAVTVNGYSVEAIHDRGQLNSSDSAYFYTKLEEVDAAIKEPGLILIQQEVITTPVSAVDFDLPAGYSRFFFVFDEVTDTGGYTLARLSYDGGSTFADDLYGIYSSTVDLGGAGSNSVNEGSTSYMYIFTGGNQTVNKSGSLNINNDSGSFTMCGLGVVQYSGGGGARSETLAFRDQTSKADTLRLLQAVSGREYTAGTFSLYAYKETV